MKYGRQEIGVPQPGQNVTPDGRRWPHSGQKTGDSVGRGSLSARRPEARPKRWEPGGSHRGSPKGLGRRRHGLRRDARSAFFAHVTDYPCDEPQTGCRQHADQHFVERVVPI